ncbi:MAG: hypothetical protein ABF289_09260 [Clostridiales bacterium]
MIIMFTQATDKLKDVNAELLLEALSPMIYTAMVILAFIVIGKGLIRGEPTKNILSKLVLCAVIAFMAYKPTVFRNIGETVVNLVTTFANLFS